MQFNKSIHKVYCALHLLIETLESVVFCHFISLHIQESTRAILHQSDPAKSQAHFAQQH